MDDIENKNVWYTSDDSSDEAVKPKSKFSKIDENVEDGELSSDIDGAEPTLEKLFKNKEDRRKLQGMTEKEREEEIFKRSRELNDLKSRQKVMKKLNEQKKTESSRLPKNNKRSLADVFSQCSDDESIFSNSSIDSSNLPAKKSKVSSPQINPRQKALENQKSSKNAILSLLNENRKQKKEREEKQEKKRKEDTLKKSIFESNSDDSEEKKINNVDRHSIISSSSSEQLDDQQDEIEDKYVEELEDLAKIRLSRHKLENWVHMPFFKELVKGCFVRVNIGEGPAVVPIYRIAEIIDVVETVKIYDLGKTRTNVGLKLQIGKSATMFRLLFVSNQSFLQAEFDSWRRRVVSDGYGLPRLSAVEAKASELKRYENFSISNEEIMKQVLTSKKRFQKGPVNIAMHKAELTRQKMAADNDGDNAAANKIQEEIDELNMKAEKLERKRTVGIKNISYINQRNRETTMIQVEKAIELEIAEKLEWDKVGGDPFVREPTMPVLNYRKKKQERMERETVQEVPKEAPEVPKVDNEVPEALKVNINNIHDFEVQLDIRIDAAKKATVVVPACPPPVATGAGAVANGNRRALNLQDYKRRKGLI